MKLLSFLLLIIAALSTLNACKTTNSASVTSNANTSENLLFVGCVPSLGECRYSCPERNGQGVADKSQCFDDYAPIACGCPANGFVPPTPPDDTLYDYVGCVPSGSECRYSCNSRNIITFQGSPQCEMRQFACYCRK